MNPSSDNDRFTGETEEANGDVTQSPPRPNLDSVQTEHQTEVHESHDPPTTQVLTPDPEEQSNPVHHSQISDPQSVFRGSGLVDWLVERGLCSGRGDAELYGSYLQQGEVLDHVTGQHSFRDEASLLYYFTNRRRRWTETGQAQNA